MHFWNIEKLAEKLANGSISEWQKGCYYLGLIIVSIFIDYAYAYIGESPSYRDTDKDISTAIALVIKIAINVLGIILLFNLHSKHCSTGFLDKVVCFGLPAKIHTIVVGWFGLAGVTMGISVFNAEWLTMMVDLLWPTRPVLGVIYFNLLFFVYMYRGFSKFNEKIMMSNESYE